ncbi:choice-of-anchor J domain-containing protein [bacterium]|nr:choice-of-anchor J domain-containing protein [bacterium]
MKTQRIFLLLIISFTSSFLLLNANTLKASQVLFPELLTTISHSSVKEKASRYDGNDEPWNAIMLTLPVEEELYEIIPVYDIDFFRLPSLCEGDNLVISIEDPPGHYNLPTGLLFGPSFNPHSIDLSYGLIDVGYYREYIIPESGDYYLVVYINTPSIPGKGDSLQVKDNDYGYHTGPYLLSVSCNRNNEYDAPTNFLASNNVGSIDLTWDEPQIDSSLLGYYILKDRSLLTNEIIPAGTTSYQDSCSLVYGSEHEYYIIGVYSQPLSYSLPSNIENIVYLNIGAPLWGDDFEDHPDFALNMPNWTQYDVDGTHTHIMSNVDYEHAGQPTSFMVFNPSSTSPPLENLIPQSGEKFIVAFAPPDGINDDWLITPAVSLGSNTIASFYARSVSSDSVLARFTCNMSLGGSDLVDFQWSLHHEVDYYEVPTEWTYYQFDVSLLSGYTIRFGIQSINPSNSALLIDNFRIDSSSDTTDNDNTENVPNLNILFQNYPNPFNPKTTISYNLAKDQQVTLVIYNIKGQKVKTLVNNHQDAGNHNIVWSARDDNNKSVASGIYFYQLRCEDYVSTNKMILLK